MDLNVVLYENGEDFHDHENKRNGIRADPMNNKKYAHEFAVHAALLH